MCCLDNTEPCFAKVGGPATIHNGALERKTNWIEITSRVGLNKISIKSHDAGHSKTTSTIAKQ
jgi:hypothetical protein